MLPTPGMKATATGGALCSECGGSFPSQVALAQHLLDHNRLRALDGGVPIAVAVPTPSPVEHPTAIPPVAPVEGPRPPPVSTPPPLQNGLVMHYNVEGDFGFITRGDGSEDVFFHLQACDVQTPAISVGEIVQFEDVLGPKGWRAIRVVRKNPGVFNQERPGESPRTPTRKPSPRDEAGILRAKQKALAKLPQVYQGGRYPRFVYVDLDNIWTSFMKAKHILDYFPGAESTRDLLFNLGGLTRRLATGGPNSSVAQLVAFYFKTSESIANALRKVSHGGVPWDVRKQETISDTSMQLELFNEVRNCEAYPKTLVLVTGDGNITPDGKSFRNIVDRYLQHGWYVEVHAWLSTTAQSYIEFQRQYPSQVVIRPFDDELVEELVQARDHVAKKVLAANNDEVVDNTESKPPKSNLTNAGKDQDQGDPQFSSHTSALVNAPASSENEIKLPQQPSQSERVIALARAMSEMVSDSDTPTGIQEEPKQSEVSERFFRERLFETVVRLLDVANDSATYIPSALAVLGITRPYEALHLQEAESTSQHVLLRSSLQRELDRMRAGSGSSK